MLLFTLVATVFAAVCSASSYGIHWPAGGDRIDLHLARGSPRVLHAIKPGSKPSVGHRVAFGYYWLGWTMKPGSASTMTMTDNYNTVMCLDPGSPPQLRNQVTMQHCTGSGDQLWVATNNSVIKLKNYDLCLDVPSGNMTKGFVQLWPCNTKNPNQIWTFD